MKPRSKKEKQFVEMAGKLPPLDEKRKEWAKGLFPAQTKYYSRRGNNCEFWCQCCGAIVPTLGKWLLADYAAGKWTCPECGAECEVLPQYSGGFSHDRNTRTGERSKPSDDVKRVTLVDVFQGVQVFRTFEVYRWNYRDGNDERGRWKTKPTEFEYREIFQNWVLEDGSEIITSKPYTRSIWSMSWHTYSDYGIGRHNAHCSGYYQMEDVYDLQGNYIFPGHKVVPLLKRNGWSARYFPEGADPAALAKELLKGEPKYETLMKARQPGVVFYLMTHGGVNIRDYWAALKICIRNGYRVPDAGLWFDYVNDLMFLGLDVHNAHYVCPKNLRRAHDVTSRRRGRIVREREDRDKALEGRKFEKIYRKAKKPFIGMVFGDERVQVVVLNSVEEVRQEAAAMHHCVFRNGYYKKGDNLLLSARDAVTGKRLETVEISLKSFNVLQSRALQNGQTKEHQHILDLCRENVPEMRKRAAKMTVPLCHTLSI